MGSGTKRPTARPAPKRSVMADEQGRPTVRCPDEGRFSIHGDHAPGTSVTFRVEASEIVVRSGESVLARFASSDFANLAKCIEDGADYYGEVEVDDGETFVRFWMG